MATRGLRGRAPWQTESPYRASTARAFIVLSAPVVDGSFTTHSIPVSNGPRTRYVLLSLSRSIFVILAFQTFPKQSETKNRNNGRK